MNIELRLKELLQRYNLDNRGVTQRISKDLGVHRHTIGHLYRNELTNPSLEVLGRLCDWLCSNRVPADILPGALFGCRPSKLWQAVVELGAVTFYLGEYEQLHEQTQPKGRPWRWISLRDAEVLTDVVRNLSTRSEEGASRKPMMNTEYVRFRYGLGPSENQTKEFREDIVRARELFNKQMRSKPLRGSSIMIGSQRVNYVVELFVADLAGCEAFPKKKERPKVPFYVFYRDWDRQVPSCFGGREKLPGLGRPGVPGIYYRDKNEKWVCCPWAVRENGDEKGDEDDAGIIITSYDPGSKGLEMAVFGFSGRGTEAVGAKLLRDPDEFWPPVANVNGREVGVYICRLRLPGRSGSTGSREQPYVACEVVKLDANILKNYLQQ